MRKLVFWASLGLIFLIPWEDSITLAGLGTASRFVGLLVAGLWIALVAYEGRLRRFGPFHLVAFLFVLWNLASVFWSVNVSNTIIRVQTYIQLIGLMAIVWDLYDSEKALNSGLQAFVLGAYVTVGSAIYNFVNGIEFSPGRFSSAGANPDEAGMILAIAMAIAWYLTINTSAGSGQIHSRILTILNSAYIPAALLGIALTATRTALLATAPALLFMFLSLNRLKLITRISILLFVVLLSYFIFPYIPQVSLERLASTGSELSTGTLGGRLSIWQQGLSAFTLHPIVGIGSNTFRTINSVGKVAHNSLLSILVELGLVGTVLFGAMLFIAFSQALRLPRTQALLTTTIFVTWLLGASALTWEHKKISWFLLSLIVTFARSYSLRPLFKRPLVQNTLSGSLLHQSHLTRHKQVTGNIP